MDKWLPIIVQLAIVIVSAAGGWYLLRDQKGKLRAESEGVIVNTAKGLVGTLREELDRANEKITALETESDNAQKKFTTLEVESKANKAETDFLRKEISVLKLSTDTEISGLKAEQGKMQKRIAFLTKGIGILTEQIRNLGHEPAWVDNREPG